VDHQLRPGGRSPEDRLAPQALHPARGCTRVADVEVIDAQGRRCPTDQARVDFALSGPATLLGSYNAGIQYSVFKPYANTECGINRVFARATRTAGPITLAVTRKGLATGSVTITSAPITLTGGLLVPHAIPSQEGRFA
jgi:beta-galactosidase